MPKDVQSLPLSYEINVWESSSDSLVAGVDEAGRGPIAGPVVAACCIMLPEELWNPKYSKDSEKLSAYQRSSSYIKAAGLEGGISDSKTILEEKRETLFTELLSSPALVFGVSVVDHVAIDRVNILAATMYAMERALCSAKSQLRSLLSYSEKNSDQPYSLHGLSPEEWRIVFPSDAAVPQSPQTPNTGESSSITTEAPLAASLCGHKLATKDVHATNLHSVFIDGPRAPPRLAFRARIGAGEEKEEDWENPNPETDPIVAKLLDFHGTPLLQALGNVQRVLPVVDGDNKVFSIAAASIIAKVVRDRLMEHYGALYPGYGLEVHKGYPTPGHKDAVAKLGRCPIHRLTFAPLKTMYPDLAKEARGAELTKPAAKKAASKGQAAGRKRATKATAIKGSKKKST